VRLTVSVPFGVGSEPMPLQLAGRAVIEGREVRHTAIPAEDMMQAFIYHHLVPAKEWLVAAIGVGVNRPTVRLLDPRLLKFRPGETAEVRFSVPPLPPEVKIHLQLSDPPEGMAIEETRTTRDGATVVLRADAEKSRPGLKGNLILEAFAERTAGTGEAKPAANRFQFKVATLPAVPFEIVGR